MVNNANKDIDNVVLALVVKTIREYLTRRAGREVAVQPEMAIPDLFDAGEDWDEIIIIFERETRRRIPEIYDWEVATLTVREVARRIGWL